MLGVQKFSDHIRWLQLANCFYVLFYRSVMISLRIQMIAILSEYIDEALSIVLLIFGYPESSTVLNDASV